jgi:hypothetical protein
MAAVLESEHTEAIERHELRVKTRGDMLVKYFSDKVAPAIHDIALQKEAFSSWKEGFIRSSYGAREKCLRSEMVEVHSREIRAHQDRCSSALVKYFSEKVNPTLHDVAAQKEAFLAWSEEYTHSEYYNFKTFNMRDDPKSETDIIL